MRSLGYDEPCDTRVSPRGEARSYTCRWRVATEGATRLGGGGSHDLQLPKKTGTWGFSDKYFRTQHLLRSGDSIRVLDLPLP
jgi:hypothetical protein